MMTTHMARIFLLCMPAFLVALGVAGCRTDTTGASPGAVTPGVSASRIADEEPPRFSDWSTPVNVGSPVNTDSAELSAALSRDDLSLYFQCFNCPENIGRPDVWVARRASVDSPWGDPRNLGSTVNSAFPEAAVTLSPDGHRLFFTSNRPAEFGGLGGNDIYVSRRRDQRDDFGWGAPENLGSGVNSPFNDAAPAYFDNDEDRIGGNEAATLFFSSNRPGLGATDIYASTLQPDGTFGPAVRVEELSSAFRDEGPSIRRDGLEIYFSSNRPGSTPPPPGMPDQGLDLWVATRASTSDPWSTPMNVGAIVNSEFIDAGPELSFDGTTLYFHSPFRPGNLTTQFDLWVTTRSMLRGE